MARRRLRASGAQGKGYEQAGQERDVCMSVSHLVTQSWACCLKNFELGRIARVTIPFLRECEIDNGLIDGVDRPETMGAVSAVVYLLIIIVFIPFPFYKDIVAATSGGGNKDQILHVENVDTGRYLHRFPHSKVGYALEMSPRPELRTFRKSLLPTSPRSYRCSPSSCSALATTYSTYAGGTSCSSRPSPPYRCSSSTLSTLA